MIEEVDMSEFNELKAEKRHKELITTLKNLSSVVKELEPFLLLYSAQGKELLSSIHKTNDTFGGVSNEVHTLSANVPNLKLILNNVAELLNKISVELKSINSQRQEKPEYEFEVSRNAAGYIQSVKAKIKN